MPFNGSGTFVSLGLPDFPAVAGELILADRFNNNLNDIFTLGLTKCMTRDGQSPPTANIPMAGFKLTGLGDATAAGDAVNLGQSFAKRGVIGAVDWDTRTTFGVYEADAASLAAPATNFPTGASVTAGVGQLLVLNQGSNIIQVYADNGRIFTRRRVSGVWTAWLAYESGVGAAGTGLVTRTALNTYVGRTLTASGANVTVTNGNGVSGNPTINWDTSVSLTVGSTAPGNIGLELGKQNGASTSFIDFHSHSVLNDFDVRLGASGGGAGNGLGTLTATAGTIDLAAGTLTHSGSTIRTNANSPDLVAIEALAGTGPIDRTATNVWENFSIAGMVAPFAMSTAPTGWLKCNGAAVSRTTYARLFAAIGTTWGAGDGSTTFNVPELRGEFIRGWADGRAVDTGRVFGSFQAEATLAHNHTASSASASIAHTHTYSATSLVNSVNHTHGISITSAIESVNHSHDAGTLVTASDGAHTHTVDTSQVAGETGVDRAATAGVLINTSSAGAHTHTISGTTTTNSVNHTHLVSGTSAANSANHTHFVSGTTDSTDPSHSHTITVNNSSGVETRPRNYALLYCIKT